MERLTYRDCAGVACFRWENPRGTAVIANEAISRLAAYEDTGLTPEEIRSVFNEDAVPKLAAQALGTTADRLREICEAERDGRLVVLPCKVGDTVYENRWGEVEVAYGYMQPQFDTFSKRFSLYDFYKLGKTVFLTRAEAEAALQKGAQHE